MKKLIITICLLIGMTAAAQNIDLEPGLYIVNGDQYTRIEAQRGIAGRSTAHDISINHYRYKGTNANVESTGEFLLVCDMSRKAAVITPRKVNVFVNWITPVHLRAVELRTGKRNRMLYTHDILDFLKIVDFYQEKTNFEWEKCADNAYRITYRPEEPGEYAFISLLTAADGFNPEFIWGFTVK